MRSAVHFCLFIILLLGLDYAAWSQDKIIMMSGSVIRAKVLNTDNVFVEFEQMNKRGTLKQLNVSRYEVFSIQYEDGTEEVIYRPDPMEDDMFSEEEMRVFIAGERDAYDNYKPKAAFWAGVGLGLAAGIAGEGNFLYSIGTPVVWGAGMYLPNIKIKEATMSDLSYKHNNTYALGYERVARTRLMLSGLKGGALGSFVGTTIGILLEKNSD